MRIIYLVAALALLSTPPPVNALDAACEPILAASAARISQPEWHSVTEMGGGFRLEVIKAGGRFFSNAGDEWSTFGDVDEAERNFVASIRSGEIAMTECTIVGADVAGGTEVIVYSSRTEMPGAPAASAKLSVGKADGLPYRQTGEGFTATYRYTDVVAPTIP